MPKPRGFDEFKHGRRKEIVCSKKASFSQFNFKRKEEL
jgi:hypothetical protein